MSARIPLCPLSRRPGALLKGYELPWHEQLDAVTTYFIDFCAASVAEPERRMVTMREAGKRQERNVVVSAAIVTHVERNDFIIYGVSMAVGLFRRIYGANAEARSIFMCQIVVTRSAEGAHKKRDSRGKRDVVTWNCQRISDAVGRRSEEGHKSSKLLPP